MGRQLFLGCILLPLTLWAAGDTVRVLWLGNSLIRSSYDRTVEEPQEPPLSLGDMSTGVSGMVRSNIHTLFR